jgi:uncharacterized protein YndB with AHSA1/START domain
MSEKSAAAAKAVISPDSDAITCEVEIAAPPERVFQALTQSNQLASWWGSETWKVEVWEMDARPGGKWRFVTVPQDKSSAPAGVTKYELKGEVLEFVPPRLLIYSWLSDGHAEPNHPTVVRWDLSRTAKGTLLKMTHSGLAKEHDARKGYGGGWPGVIERLKNFAEK